MTNQDAHELFESWLRCDKDTPFSADRKMFDAFRPFIEDRDPDVSERRALRDAFVQLILFQKALMCSMAGIGFHVAYTIPSQTAAHPSATGVSDALVSLVLRLAEEGAITDEIDDGFRVAVRLLNKLAEREKP